MVCPFRPGRGGKQSRPYRGEKKWGRHWILGCKADVYKRQIVDRLIDGVFPVLEQLEDEVELIEDEIFADPKPVQLSQILKLKRELLNLRRLISPQREMLSRLSRREDLPYIQPRTAIYFRDVYDHAVRIEEAAIILTDFASGVAEAYLSVASNRMNEAMRVLTVLSTIFMPLTFIAGIYGMNFDYMPELKMTWFYPFLWVVMIVIAAAMLVFLSLIHI